MIRLGQLARSGPRQQIAMTHLQSFIEKMVLKAEPFQSSNYSNRFHSNVPGAVPFQTLSLASFEWPVGRTWLAPSEIAKLIKCHASLILKAICTPGMEGLGKRKTTYRWMITRRAWEKYFPDTIKVAPRFPTLPKGPMLSISEVALHLRLCGLPNSTPYRVRKFINSDQLDAIRLGSGQRKQFVTSKSLKKLRSTLLTSIQVPFFDLNAADDVPHLGRGVAEEYHKSQYRR